jgi:hypothetical protein
MEFEYRRFLCLMKLFPNEQTVPLFDVDIFRHYHILDTLKNEVDCDNDYGYLLHHFPYVGLRGEDDEAAHHRGGPRMQELYEATFGEAYIRQDEVPAAAKTAFSTVVAKTAFSTVVSKSAFSTVVAKTAFSTVVAKTAFSTVVAQNDPFYSVRPALSAAKTAFSTVISREDHVVRPVLGKAFTAFSTVVAQNDSSYLERPVLLNAA